MEPQNTQTKPIKKRSTKPSITGGVFSILALILSAIGNGLVHARYKSPTEVKTISEKAGEVVADGTTRTLGVIFGVPCLVGGMTLAGIAIIFTLVRLRRVKASGFIVSALWIALSIWAIMIAIGAFSLIKAHPAS